MSRPRGTPHSSPRDHRIADEHKIMAPHHHDATEATDNRDRRWYHLRPQPRRRTDLMGISSTWWMVLLWLILIVLLVYPGGWW